MPRAVAKSKQTSADMKESLILEKLPGYFLIFCLVLILWVVFEVLRPFVTVIFVAAVLAIAFDPVYQWFHRLFGKKWPRLSALCACLFVVAVILVPLSIFISLLAQEGVSTYELISEKINSGYFDKYLLWDNGGFFYDIKQNLSSVVDFNNLDLKESIVNMAQSVSTWLVSQTTNIIAGISNIMLGVVVMLFSMYYFFKDGDKLVVKIGDLSPLPSAYEVELFAKIKQMVKAVVFGVFLTAIAQGVVGGIGFAIAGISNPVFWGTAIAFFSLVPVVGTAVIWVPATIILLILGSYGAALFVFIWGVLAIGSVDNILRPYLIGGKAHTHPLMTFLVVLGGVMTMGLKGVIIGPLVLIILMSFLHIYEAEYKRVLKK